MPNTGCSVCKGGTGTMCADCKRIADRIAKDRDNRKKL